MGKQKVKKNFKRFLVQGTPLIRKILEPLELGPLLGQYLSSHGNEKISHSETLLILVHNICLGRYPLYKLGTWASSFDPQCFGISRRQILYLNDDRFARALDRLYAADRASLMTELIVRVIQHFSLNTHQIHNDSTSVKAYEKIPGKTTSGFQLKRGHSKDHRPELKQLIFNLSVSRDGAVPMHCKAYSGNRTDDTIYVQSWLALRRLLGRSDFLFVADCKICTAKQLDEIVGSGGRVVTLFPDTWKVAQDFKASLRSSKSVQKTLIWKRPLNTERKKFDRFSVVKGPFLTEHGFLIHWIYSTEKKKRDRNTRTTRLRKTEAALSVLISKLNMGKHRRKEYIESKLQETFKKFETATLYEVEIHEVIETERKQLSAGRPSSKTKYTSMKTKVLSIRWARDRSALKVEMKTDGVFPLLSTDVHLSAKEALQAYKYQPRLEKRFHHFKSVHKAAPLLFKRIERVESIFLVYFFALVVQSLIERKVRTQMKANGIKALGIYPEGRHAQYPSTEKIMEFFEGISSMELRANSSVKEIYRDPLTPTHKQILKLMGMKESEFWNGE